MKVFSIYDQGSAQHQEDGKFLYEPFFGVLDGVSASYGPAFPPQMFDGMSGGEAVSRHVEAMAKNLAYRWKNKPNLYPLDRFVRELNKEVLFFQNVAGVPVEAGELAGATFAIAKVEKKIEILQGGDCFALWEKKSGAVGITTNQVRAHDTEMNNEILRIQREVAKELFNVELEAATDNQRGKIRGEMWNRFCPVLKEARQQDVNNPESRRFYTLLNGQPQVGDLIIWSGRVEFERDEIKTLLLFSDGMVPWEAMKGMTDPEIAEKVLADYKEGGLPHLLKIARGIEKRVANINYTDSAEATAIALDFSDEE